MGIDRVAVIGAGPAGLAAAKYLAAERKFSQITVFEQRGEVGGIWNHVPLGSLKDGDLKVPRTRPSGDPDHATSSGGDTFITPLYDALETNIPHSLMRYSDRPFPEGTCLFPMHTVVKQYLEDYAEEIRPLLHLSTQVLDVKREKSTDSPWQITIKDLKSQKPSTVMFDAVMVCNGHYNDPFVPDISGLTDFATAYPGSISHSKYYRKPSEFENKKIVIVGNAASGADISAQISEACKQPVIVSEKEPGPLPADDPAISYRPEIVEFMIPERALRFRDGHVERDVDHVLFCTGYLYSYPFLKSLNPPIVTDGARARHLWEHVVYTPDTTLAFLGVPQRIVPFPISEAQAAVVARAWAGRLSLPSRQDMDAWEAATVAELGDGKSFHDLAMPRSLEYINRLHAMSMSATKEPALQLENGGVGKIPPYWDDEKKWVRERFPMIKLASKKLGEKRFEVKTLEELGFDYKAWKKEQEQEQEQEQERTTKQDGASGNDLQASTTQTIDSLIDTKDVENLKQGATAA